MSLRDFCKLRHGFVQPELASRAPRKDTCNNRDSLCTILNTTSQHGTLLAYDLVPFRKDRVFSAPRLLDNKSFKRRRPQTTVLCHCSICDSSSIQRNRQSWGRPEISIRRPNQPPGRITCRLDEVLLLYSLVVRHGVHYDGNLLVPSFEHWSVPLSFITFFHRHFCFHRWMSSIRP